MPKPYKIFEYDYLYKNGFVTAFVFNNGVKIIGFINGDKFDLRVLTVGNNPKKKGFGQKALKYLRPKFKTITVNDIQKKALPLWIKMKERHLVDELQTLKDGQHLYTLNQADLSREKVKNPEIKPYWVNTLQYLYPDFDAELEYVRAI